jgi:hypothetical protein
VTPSGTLQGVLLAAVAAEGKRHGSSLAKLAEEARRCGLDALGLRSALLARQRGYSEPPNEAEIELLFRYEQLEPLLDLAVEYRLESVLQRCVLSFAGHPDLHPQGAAAADALAAMGGVAPALPKRRLEPELEMLWEALLAGDQSLFGWGLRRYGAPFVDRCMRLAANGIASLQRLASLAPVYVEIQAGKQAALPYYRHAFEQRLGEREPMRLSLILCAALSFRELALEVCDDDDERIALAGWVLGRPGEEAIDARWLRFLSEQDLASFAEAEGQNWLAGEPARLQLQRICDEPRLATAFQPWFMAMGDFPAVLSCIESRCRIADRVDRVQLERTAAEMLEHLGQPQSALAHAAEALLLAPQESETFELVFALAKAHPSLLDEASENLWVGAHTAARCDWALRALSLLLGDVERLKSGISRILDAFSAEDVIEAYDLQSELHSGLGTLFYEALSERGALDGDRVLGFVRSQLPDLMGGEKQRDIEPLLALLQRHAGEDDRAGRLRIPLLLELGRGAEALLALDQAKVPNKGSWAVMRARAYLLEGDEGQATSLLEDAARAGNRSAATLLESLAESRS